MIFPNSHFTMAKIQTKQTKTLTIYNDVEHQDSHQFLVGIKIDTFTLTVWQSHKIKHHLSI